MLFIMYHSVLSTLICLPLIVAIILLLVPARYTSISKTSALYTSLVVFIISLYLWAAFDNSTAKFQFVESYEWIGASNIIFYLGIDGVSLFFVILTTLLIPICILASWEAIKTNVKEYMIAFLLCFWNLSLLQFSVYWI